MDRINSNDIKPHFIYKNYVTYGEEILNLKKMKFINGLINKFGYRHTTISHDGCVINYLYHRFIFECHYGYIPDGFVVNHIDNNKLKNNIENLQIITHSANIKKNYKPCSNVARAVRAVCLDTGLISDFKSIKQASKFLDINNGSIKFVCDNIYNTAVSKLMGHYYYFHYLQ